MRLRVLIVEDDPIQAAMVSAALEAHGFLVEVRYRGADAVSLLRADPRGYAAVILDLLMPEMNGFEVLRDFASIAPDLPQRTILATAAGPQTIADFDPATVRRMLLKPFNVDELVGAVRSCMEPRSMEGSRGGGEAARRELPREE